MSSQRRCAWREATAAVVAGTVGATHRRRAAGRRRFGHPAMASWRASGVIGRDAISRPAFRRRRRARARETMLRRSTPTVISSAPVQASETQSAIGAAGIAVDRDRQAGHRLGEVGRPVGVAKRGEEQRRGFAGDAGDGQQDAGEDAAERRGQDDLADDFVLAAAEGDGAIAIGLGHEAENVFRRARDDGHGEQGERDGAGNAGEAAEGRNGDLVDEQADQHGRGGQQDVVHEADDGGEAARPCRLPRDRRRPSCRAARRSWRRCRPG